MAKRNLKSILVRMPSTLKRRLAREVARRESTLNDVAVELLADEFGVDFQPSGRRGPVPGDTGVVLLRIPPELKRQLDATARERRSSTNKVVVETLGTRLGSPTPRKETMARENGSQNGKSRTRNGKVRVAIIGVGNCANSLLQGVEYYKDADRDAFVPGLMHVDLGGYHISDIEFTAAFDVVKGKVGEDLADAIWAHPNDTIKFAKVPKSGIKVSRGMTHDGIGKYLAEIVEKAPGETADIVKILRETGTDVVVNYLPVGSEAATKWYTEKILEAGCAMVNCMPVFIAREPYWQKRFEDAGVPIIGDDIKSQVGATISHRVLTSLFRERGVHLDRTMQLNVGGNSDFRNMLERDRLESKKISKTNAVTSMLDYDLGEGNVHVGPSDFVPWLTDRKWAYIRMEGTSFGDVPLNLELKLEVWDSPNSAGIVIDAVRFAKLALNNGISGALEAPSSYLMKSPPVQIVDSEAHENTERFITKNAYKAEKKAKAAASA
jgi:myo-inositol-1-phosphate synthase